MTIKRGDLVMVVAPSECESTMSIGYVFVAGELYSGVSAPCENCGNVHLMTNAIFDSGITRVPGHVYAQSRLRRIDPPATGEYDGVPVRKLQPTKETA